MIDRYQQVDIETASPVAIVAKLYEGALRNGAQAREHLQAGRVRERVDKLSKAMAIVEELQRTLDMERGGEIATNLDDLYTFVTERLLRANLDGSLEALDEAMRVLSTLNEGWQYLARDASVEGAG